MNSLIQLSPFFYIAAVFVILIFKRSLFYRKFINMISFKFKDNKYLIYLILILFLIFFWLTIPYAFQINIIIFIIIIYFENKGEKSSEVDSNEK